MDKSWIFCNRLSTEYEDGVNNFLEFALQNNEKGSTIMKCPCKKCQNFIFHELQDVKNHLFITGFDDSYLNWHWHGEVMAKNLPTDLGDQFKTPLNYCDVGNTVEMIRDAYKHCSDDPKAFKEQIPRNYCTLGQLNILSYQQL